MKRIKTDKEFQEQVCSKCKNRNSQECSIIRKIDGTYGCEFEIIEEGKNVNSK